ncbi:hypothetical protein [Chroococcus sp. FPU101]|uniref:hypothetical protein n=1 Tax=Chroococcus sp. FPU101 TaxID=1974212 RepID=UPI001A8E2FDB|nr:hypothetical protein [Chroococcus sp. FPU101]GFE69101.1 hypothetical protein CFPU101_17110 [Chroococcus sp. FPU101]
MNRLIIDTKNQTVKKKWTSYLTLNDLSLFKVLSWVGITPKDLPYVGLCSSILAYFTYTNPIFVAVLGCLCIVAMSLYNIVRAIPILEKTLSTRIRFWHVSVVILGLTIVLGQWEAPAGAVFLTGLEQLMKDLVANGSAGNGAIEEESVTQIFILFRALFLLLIVGGALYAYNQSQQGNDWRPILTQIGIAFAVIISVDVITYIFAGV